MRIVGSGSRGQSRGCSGRLPLTPQPGSCSQLCAAGWDCKPARLLGRLTPAGSPSRATRSQGRGRRRERRLPVSCLVTVSVTVALAVAFCPVLGAAAVLPLWASTLCSQNQPHDASSESPASRDLASPHLGGLGPCSVGPPTSSPSTGVVAASCYFCAPESLTLFFFPFSPPSPM